MKVGEELRYWLRAAKGAVEWAGELGEGGIELPAGYRPPPLGAIPRMPLSEAPQAPRPMAPAPQPMAQPPMAQPEPPMAQPEPPMAQPEPPMAQPEPPMTQPEPPMAQPPTQTFGGAPAPPQKAPVVIPKPALGAVGEGPAATAAALQQLRDEIGDCQRCSLCQTRTELVFGAGRPDARVMFVAEAPGFEDDQTGLPFVGAAGGLLSKMIRAMGLSREQTWLTHLVKCAAGPRGPGPDEVNACRGFLLRQIGLVEPEVIVALGSLPARVLSDQELPFARLQGQWYELGGVPVLCTFDPVAVLQNPQMKGPVWKDLRSVMRRLGLGQRAQ